MNCLLIHHHYYDYFLLKKLDCEVGVFFKNNCIFEEEFWEQSRSAKLGKPESAEGNGKSRRSGSRVGEEGRESGTSKEEETTKKSEE